MVGGYHSITIDGVKVTDSWAQKDAIRRSEHYVDLLLSHSGRGVINWDKIDTLYFTNTRLVNLTGYTTKIPLIPGTHVPNGICGLYEEDKKHGNKLTLSRLPWQKPDIKGTEEGFWTADATVGVDIRNSGYMLTSGLISPNSFTYSVEIEAKTGFESEFYVIYTPTFTVPGAGLLDSHVIDNYIILNTSEGLLEGYEAAHNMLMSYLRCNTTSPNYLTLTGLPVVMYWENGVKYLTINHPQAMEGFGGNGYLQRQL